MHQEEDFAATNFIWTSWRKNNLLEWLKPINPKEEQTHKLWEDNKLRIYSKLEDNFHLSNKKALFFNMSQYYKLMGRDPFEILPLTFHIEEGLNDPEFERFKLYYEQIEKEKSNKRKELEERKWKYLNEHSEEEYDSEEEKDEEEFYKVTIPKNIWIMKPGENSNRGTGIVVCKNLREI